MSWQQGGLWEMTKASKVITLIGAGGKTTALKRLHREIRASGRAVVSTTTTKVQPLDFTAAYRSAHLPPDMQDCFWYSDLEAETGKWRSPGIDAVDQAILAGFTSEAERHWVIEGDGAAGKKLKCWAGHEPLIPVHTSCPVLLIGGGLWGRVLEPEEVHRPEMCPNLAANWWNVERCAKYLTHSPLFSPRYHFMSWVVLFNEDSNTSKDRLEELRLALVRTEYAPVHLRIAAGDVLKGSISWADLW